MDVAGQKAWLTAPRRPSVDSRHKKRQRAEDVGDDAAVLSMDLGGGGGDDLGFDDHLVGPLGDGGDSEGWVASGEGGGDGEGEEGGVEQRSGAEAGRGPGSEAVGQEDAAKARKKQKMKNRLREKKARLGGKEFAQEKERAATIVKSGASEQSDWLWACYGRYKPGSPLEREAFDAKYLVRLDQSKGLAEAVCIAFADRGGKEFVTKVRELWLARNETSVLVCTCTCYSDRTTRSPASQAGKATRKGAPVVLVITPNAAWASHACTQLRSLNGETARVAKLFARHFKVRGGRRRCAVPGAASRSRPCDPALLLAGGGAAGVAPWALRQRRGGDAEPPAQAGGLGRPPAHAAAAGGAPRRAGRQAAPPPGAARDAWRHVGPLFPPPAAAAPGGRAGLPGRSL